MARNRKIDPVLRKDFAVLVESWRRLAASYEFAGRVSGFLEWQAKRLSPPPEDY